MFISDRKSYIEKELGEEPLLKPMEVSRESEITIELVQELIEKHKNRYVPRYRLLEDTYEGKFSIFSQADKSIGKPDNRLAVNFAKYIVDTMTGFFSGIPMKTNILDDEKNAFIENMNTRNQQDDLDTELAKETSKLGTAFELLYQDENGDIGTTLLSPLNAFVVVDDTILHKPVLAIRYEEDAEGVTRGSVSNDGFIWWFKFGNSKTEIEDDLESNTLSAPETHYFGAVPLIQHKENEEYKSIFEEIINLNDAYNKALSEKANDVDYYADAYIKVLGALLDDTHKKDLRDNRIINIAADDVEKIVVEFMAKPESDQTQENLLAHLHQLIFQVAMVADISDTNFAGNISGVALKYKLQSMSNLASIKERKVKKALIEKYKMICSYPQSELMPDDLYAISFIFTRNMPPDLASEADFADKMQGIVSQETLLSNLSIVDNATKEIQRIEDEAMVSAEAFMGDYGSERVEGIPDETDIEEVVEEVVKSVNLTTGQFDAVAKIMVRYASGELSEGQAINLISLVGVTKEEARNLLLGIV